MKKLLYILLIILLVYRLPALSENRKNITHKVYFEKTDNELHVYRIKGRLPGKTMLIIGGIQGDEPGGFLSADSYVDFALEKGNLIVVPRANLESVIMFNRGVKGDMNRLFPENEQKHPQAHIVNILKKLISESDIFLNLHDGWGYHRPKYINKYKNPNRFGQSIIIDDYVFQCTDSNKKLMLGDMASKVVEEVNHKISDKELYLHLFNTKTSDNSSKFKNMRKTATWYALTEHCIPSFGIEGSKNNKSIELNILYHNYAINAFMKLMDIIPEYPRIITVKPIMDSISIKVNNNIKTFKPYDTLILNKDDTIKIVYLESNYERGITADILDYGNLNDINKSFNITGHTKVVFRKDNEKIGEINIVVKESFSSQSLISDNDYKILLELDNKVIEIEDNSSIHVKNGSVLKLLSVLKGNKEVDMPINFKGWFPPSNKNTGDDRGYEIRFPCSRILKRYSIDKEEKIYPVVAGDNNPVVTIYLKLD